MNSDKFSVDYFKEALDVHIEKNRDYIKPLHAANSYYRSVVSSIISDNLNKKNELIRRIRNLDEAYAKIKEEIQASA